MADSFDISCPKCKKPLKIDISEAKPGNVVSCTKCKTDIRFTGDNIAKAVSDLRKALQKNLVKKLTITL